MMLLNIFQTIKNSYKSQKPVNADFKDMNFQKKASIFKNSFYTVMGTKKLKIRFLRFPIVPNTLRKKVAYIASDRLRKEGDMGDDPKSCMKHQKFPKLIGCQYSKACSSED